MTYDDLIAYFGSAASAATARAIDRQRVHGWKKRSRIPTDDQIAYEVLTQGGLKADLPTSVREQGNVSSHEVEGVAN